MRVLTWNLFHGRAVPERRRSLLAEFAAALAGWDWDIALLQEVPPWWPARLGRACGASARMALTSRNWLLPLRRPLAERRPDLLRSNGGGCNAILARGAPAAAHLVRTLSRWPERRVMHAVLLGDGTWIANLHAQGPDDLARADVALAARTALAWAARAPVVLGGDLNLARPVVKGFAVLASHHVDHVCARGLVAAGPGTTPDRHGLSDHAPLVVTLRKDAQRGSV